MIAMASGWVDWVGAAILAVGFVGGMVHGIRRTPEPPQREPLIRRRPRPYDWTEEAQR